MVSEIKQSIYQVATRQVLGGYGTPLQNRVFKLIQINFAQLIPQTSNGNDSSGTMRFEEQMALAAVVVNRMQNLLEQMANVYHWAHVPEMAGHLLEYQITLVALHRLAKWSKFGELLEFQKEFKHLEDLEVEPVTVTLDRGQYVAMSVSPKSGPCVHFAFKSKNSQETLRGIKTRTGAPFILPDNLYGPDVHSWWRERWTGKLIEMIIQAKFTGGVQGLGNDPRQNTVADALASLDTDHLYGMEYNPKVRIHSLSYF